jgi:hypothetical protein
VAVQLASSQEGLSTMRGLEWNCTLNSVLFCYTIRICPYVLIFYTVAVETVNLNVNKVILMFAKFVHATN